MAPLSVLLQVLLVSSSFVLLPYCFDLLVLSIAHRAWLLSQAIGVPNPPRLTLDGPFVLACHIVLWVTLVVIYVSFKAEDILRACTRVRRAVRAWRRRNRA